MVRLIKAFCGVGPDASWGMFYSKITPPDRRRKPKKQTAVKNGKS
ncbi:MAG: hypothetical protein PVH61_40940 [Candidatus Aminicenantes bacterium]